jgi:molybdopterin-binding protein
LKGTISIVSKPRIGTEIRVQIPVEQALAASASQMGVAAVKGKYGASEDKDLAS